MAALHGARHDGAVRVLVVEDEETLADAIARGLRREGMAVDVAGDGGSALEKAATNGYDVVVLDRDLPVVHGDDVCRRLIASSPAPGATSTTGSKGSCSAPTTTSANRSPSPNSWPASAPWPGGAGWR